MLSGKNGKSSKKGQKYISLLFELKLLLYCKCILAALLQSRAQYLKIFVLNKALNFVLLVPPSRLIYYGPANWSFRGQIPCANFFVIIYYEVLYFFSESVFPIFFIFFFFAFWRKKIRRHLIKSVLNWCSARFS